MRRAGLLVVLMWFLPGAAGAQGIGIGIGLGNTPVGKPRGRLVVACDMTSDTCSDGRKITTTRATPVPCETSPGVWETVGVDEGCYGVRGLESWAATTSYLSYGSELDREPWAATTGAEIMQLADGFRVCHTTSSVNHGLRQTHTIGLDETATLSVIARRNTASGLFLSPFSNGGGVITMSPAGWGTYSRTETRTAAAAAFIYPRPGGVAQCVDLLAAWLTKSNTPGRPCWGGEAPVTCGADVTSIGTEGWPVVAGEVSVIYTPGTIDDESKYLVSAATFSLAGWEVYVRFGSALAFLSHAGGSTRIVESDPLTWEARPYHIRVRWHAGEVVFWRDGVEVGRTSLGLVPAGTLPSTARIGLRSSGTSGWIGGSISTLRIRSFE